MDQLDLQIFRETVISMVNIFGEPPRFAISFDRRIERIWTKIANELGVRAEELPRSFDLPPQSEKMLLELRDWVKENYSFPKQQ